MCPLPPDALCFPAEHWRCSPAGEGSHQLLWHESEQLWGFSDFRQPGLDCCFSAPQCAQRISPILPRNPLILGAACLGPTLHLSCGNLPLQWLFPSYTMKLVWWGRSGGWGGHSFIRHKNRSALSDSPAPLPAALTCSLELSQASPALLSLWELAGSQHHTVWLQAVPIIIKFKRI